jgi:hypothetical protein
MDQALGNGIRLSSHGAMSLAIYRLAMVENYQTHV